MLPIVQVTFDARRPFDFLERIHPFYSTVSTGWERSPWRQSASACSPDGESTMATLPLDHRAVANTSGAVPLAGRIGIAAIFILSGLSKLSAPAATIGYIQSAGLPLPQLGYAIAVLVELVGASALILGYRTRQVAGVLAAFSIATALAFHAALGDQNQFIHFFKNVAIAGGLLNVMAFGGGAWSLDALRRAS
jgi:putative oxidoreductase